MNGIEFPTFDRRSAAVIKGLPKKTASLAYALWSWGRYFGLPVILTEGRRSWSRQVSLVAQGASKTYHSRHLNGRAFDIAFEHYGYNVPEDWWELVGEIGEALGLTWGGRWSSFVDKPHFEL